ncbi:MAG: hypothetical protein VX938_00660 [Myxococcota bacterium]|nr:hypothetical protein [Myxococcota bacterium]
MEPRLGQVMGVSWGCSTEELLSVHPELTPERDEPDVTTYSLAQFRVGGDLPARCIFTFWFGELVSVEFTLTEASPEDVDTAAAPLMATFAELAQRTGVGLLRLQEGRTRLEVDRLDARIRLEEVPQ